ncbi:MAG: hypothetical protein KJO22_06355 [Bacteroidia bacterium]|nr:hypothetical protein [Bacteroidia bacterium]
MKNNVLGALVVFFAVVACLLILDDLTANYYDQSKTEEIQQPDQKNEEQLATIEHQ